MGLGISLGLVIFFLIVSGKKAEPEEPEEPEAPYTMKVLDEEPAGGSNAVISEV